MQAALNAAGARRAKFAPPAPKPEILTKRKKAEVDKDTGSHFFLMRKHSNTDLVVFPCQGCGCAREGYSRSQACESW